jgi:predicted ATPase
LVVKINNQYNKTVNMNDVGKSSFVDAMSTRKDSVFEKVIQEFTCLETVYSIVS